VILCPKDLLISFVPAMTHIDPSEATIEHVVDHIEYAASLVSYNNVGIGTDFDGMEKSVVGLEDVTRFLDLVRLMLKRGISRENIERVIGLNGQSEGFGS
jgi:membrane dipeptidase